MEEYIEKVYVIQPVTSDGYKRFHDESVALIKAAGAVYIGTCFQNIREVNSATFIGSGKLKEIYETIAPIDNLTILFNGDLSPSQTLNISAALGNRKVIDRTTLILDIFAVNAMTSEGKIQVEIAQLKYLYPRLKGKGEALSRLGGGIGTRGPGETKLETDRRHIAYRLKFLENKLKETELRRKLQSDRRQKSSVRTIALVGYTNTGKSTLLNLLTGSDVISQDSLFVTLDPTARKFEVDGETYLLIDTVGFIQQLPHSLVEAFKSTLEVAEYCDLALVVADASDDYNLQFDVSLNILKELGFKNEYLKVLNKCDLIESTSTLPPDCVLISAKHNKGIAALKESIKNIFSNRFCNLKLTVPYSKIGEYESDKSFCKEINREYSDSCIFVEVCVDKIYIKKFEKYVSKKN